MDINAYIESGILELYVMDALSPAEISEVEALSAMHPAIKARIRNIQDTFSAFALHDALPPRPALKEAIMHQIEQTPLPVSPAVTTAPHSTTGLSTWAVLAITAMVLALSALAYQAWINQQARASCRQQTEEVQQKLNFLLNQGTIPIALKGTESHPDALVTIFWNARQGKTLLEIKNLPALPDELQYQLWSLKDGKPKSAGLLSMANAGELQSMLNVEEADAFAITIEQKGGVESPTLNQMVVIGKV